MPLIRLEFNPSPRQLAQFGVAWLLVFGVLGGIALSRSGATWAAPWWTAAILVPGIGYFLPALLRTVYVAVACVTFPIGVVVSLVVLAAVYYLVLTPLGLLLRLAGYDPMCRRRDANAISYWTPRKPADDIRRYFRQF